MTRFTPRSNLVTQAFVWEKVKIIYFFGNFCSLRFQSCLKHSTQWVNEVEWVSMVKVILWPWSKVTQISKLNVWLLACILRWAIQGLLALLFLFEWEWKQGLSNFVQLFQWADEIQVDLLSWKKMKWNEKWSNWSVVVPRQVFTLYDCLSISVAFVVLSRVSCL